jgi:hypothetical protein
MADGDTFGVLALTSPAPGATMAGGGVVELLAQLPVFSCLSESTFGILSIVAPSSLVSLASLGTYGGLRIAAPSPSLVLSGGQGTGGLLQIIAPSPILAIDENRDTGGALLLSAPTPVVSFREFIEAWRCLVMNTDNMALSHYQGYDFIGFAKIGRTYLGLNKDGNIYALAGDTDNGNDIDAVFETGHDDFGSDRDKKLCGLVVGLRSGGEMQYRPNRDDGYGALFSVESTGLSRIETRRIDAEKTEASRAFGIELSNVDGSDFSVHNLELIVNNTVRRSGG